MVPKLGGGTNHMVKLIPQMIAKPPVTPENALNRGILAISVSRWLETQSNAKAFHNRRFAELSDEPPQLKTTYR